MDIPFAKSATTPRVLLVFEDELHARTLARCLDRRGWQVIRAARAEDALSVWRSSGAQVALVDFDADRLAALSLLSAAQAELPNMRAVISTDSGEVKGLSPFTLRRLGIRAVTRHQCHVDQLAAVLAQAADLAIDGGLSDQEAS
jgi:ActR/RegA family two-component response regulator